VTAHTAAHDHQLMGAILVSAADMGSIGSMPREKLVSLMADDMETLQGVTAESMADEVASHGKEFTFNTMVDGLTTLPLLVLSANDGLAPGTDALVAAVRAKGNTRVTSIHQATDHSWSDHRIYLESTIITWLEGLQESPGSDR
jgi:hypothetical protein